MRSASLSTSIFACVPMGSSEIRIAKTLHQMRKIALPGLRVGRAQLRKRKIGQDIGVAVERLVVDALQIVLRIEKEISEDNVSESLDGARELFVAVIFLREFVEIGQHARIGPPALLFALHHSAAQFTNGRGRLVRFAECNVEGRDFRAVLAQRVQHLREIRARKRPAAQNFLRALVDVHNHDARIGILVGVRPKPEAQIERIQFQPVDEREQAPSGGRR